MSSLWKRKATMIENVVEWEESSQWVEYKKTKAGVKVSVELLIQIGPLTIVYV